MTARTFVAKINIRQGEIEHTTHRLLVARNDPDACRLSDSVICMMYSEPDEVEIQDGTVMVYGGEVALTVHSVREIGLATFLEMRNIVGIPCYCDDGLYEPKDDELADLKGVGTAIAKSLQAQGNEISHCQVLNAVASAVGTRNWNQYKASVVPNHLLFTLLLDCSYVKSHADGTKTSNSYINKMAKTCDSIQEILKPRMKSITVTKVTQAPPRVLSNTTDGSHPTPAAVFTRKD